MSNNEFEKLVKAVVLDYENTMNAELRGEELTEENIFIVWICKTLQNNKALVSTTIPGSCYYELTYNGDKDELYFDAYKKVENTCISNPLQKMKEGN